MSKQTKRFSLVGKFENFFEHFFQVSFIQKMMLRCVNQRLSGIYTTALSEGTCWLSFS